MGIITHLLVTDITSGKKRCEVDGFGQKTSSYPIPDLTPFMVCSLLSISRNDVCEEQSAMPLVYTSSDEVTWLWQIPEDLVRYIKDLDPGSLDKLSQEWLNSDLNISTVWRIEWLKNIMSQMQKAAIESEQTQNPVFLRVSL